MKKREISFLNVLLCLTVIFIHITSAHVASPDKGSARWLAFFAPWRLAAFAVQGFIFLSALKMYLKPVSRKGYFRYWSKRFKKIIIPYAAANLLFYCYFVGREYFPFDIRDFVKYTLKGDLVAHFYFVIVIAQFYLLKPLWDLVVIHTKNRPRAKAAVLAASLLISLASSGALPNLVPTGGFAPRDRIFTTYLVYWIWGMFAGAEYDAFSENVKNRRVLWLLFPLAAAAELCTAYRSFTRGGIVYAESVHFLYCICAIFFAFALSLKFADRLAEFKTFKRLDGASYYIYLLHPLFIFVSDRAMEANGISGTGITFAVRGAVTYIGACSAAVGYVWLKNIYER